MRKFYGYSQAHIASVVGVSRPTFIEIEQGKRELTLREAGVLAALFQISLEDLAHGAVQGKITRNFN